MHNTHAWALLSIRHRCVLMWHKAAWASAANSPLRVASWLKLYCVLAMQMGNLSKPMLVKRCTQRQKSSKKHPQHSARLLLAHAELLLVLLLGQVVAM